MLVATDDARIAAAVATFGGEARLTRASHNSGTERLAEVFEAIECDLVVNLQGDEPLLETQAIAQALTPFSLDAGLEVSTLATRIRDPETLLSPSAVKVRIDADGYALGFSRVPVPAAAPGIGLERVPYYKHIGLYVYRRDYLLRFVTWPPSEDEQRERLEQLRMLAHGTRIRVVETPRDSIGIDTPEDLARAEAALQARKL